MKIDWVTGNRGELFSFANQAKFAEHMQKAVWVVQPVCKVGAGPKRVVLATGCCVHPSGYILTTSHIFRDDQTLIKIRLISPDKKMKLKGNILDRKPEWDLALLEVVGGPADQRYDYAALMGEGEKPFVGEKVYVIGHPAGLLDSFQSGSVMCELENSSDLDEDVKTLLPLEHDKDLKLLQLGRILGAGGIDGAAVFTARGEIVGVVISCGPHGEAVLFCVSLDNIREFIERHV